MDFKNYYNTVNEEAEGLVKEYEEELVSEAETHDFELYNFFDDLVHQSADSDFTYVDLHDCADILDSSDNVETDSGLWEGQEPIEAVKSMAFFTYRNDLMEAVQEKAKEFLQEKVEELEETLQEKKSRAEHLDNSVKELDSDSEEYEEAEQEYEELEEEIDELETTISNIEDTIEK